MNRVPTLRAWGAAAFEQAFARRMLRLRKTVELNATSCSNAPAGPTCDFAPLLSEPRHPDIVWTLPIGRSCMAAVERWKPYEPRGSRTVLETRGGGFPPALRLPLYRQSRIFACDGIDLDRSTLAGWVGKSTALLLPLAGRLPKARSWLRHKDQTAPAASTKSVAWNPRHG